MGAMERQIKFVPKAFHWNGLERLERVLRFGTVWNGGKRERKYYFFFWSIPFHGTVQSVTHPDEPP